ncbi:MAG: type VI secretion system baseplate subunit TssG [Rhodoferax sp.]|nr:type VI secretion system baseplate subunit TssG [Rhodoferax sp.]
MKPATNTVTAVGDVAAGGALNLQGFAQSLRSKPDDFDLFFALRVLQAQHPTLPRLGRASRPQAEPIRLGQDPSMAFAPSTIAEMLPATAGQPERLMVWNFGLYGPNGPMPTHITEYVRDRLRQYDDPTLARFSDIFHHRLLLLFFRAWSDAQPTASLDRPGEDAFGRHLGALVGIGQPSMRARDAVPDHAKLHLAGHLTRSSRNPEGLRAAIASYFQVPVELQEYCLHYLNLEPAQQTRLATSACNSQLGVDALVGERIPDVQSKFRLLIGPLSRAQYELFLPQASHFAALVDWVRNYLGIEFAWDYTLILSKQAVPPAQLGADTRLGWTTWISEAPPEQDPGDLCIDAELWLQQRRHAIRGTSAPS